MASKLIQPYIKHDDNASSNGKLMRLSLDFRKLAKSMEREELENFAALGAYGAFWRIIEYMHNNKFMTADIEMLADSLRIKTEFVAKIMTEYELFRVQDDEYVSDRLLRDLEKQEEKRQKASESATIRFLLSEFNKNYLEFFNEEPVLSSKEIENLKNYAKKITNLRDKLRDIIYTLSTLKFEKADIKFVPCANWLLKDNNLARLINGEFGKLKHKPTPEELKEEQRIQAELEVKSKLPSELEVRCDDASNKEDALELIKDFYQDKPAPTIAKGRAMLIPPLRALMKRFDIDDNEVMRLWEGAC